MKGELELPFAAGEASRRSAAEPSPVPHQRGAPPRHPNVANVASAGVMHPCATEPARRAPRAHHRRLDLHNQLARRVDLHSQHACLTQPHPHPHNIRSHRGPPGSVVCQSPIPAGPRPLNGDPQPPRSPRIREGSIIETGMSLAGLFWRFQSLIIARSSSVVRSRL